MDYPLAVVYPDGSFSVFQFAIPFVHVSGLKILTGAVDDLSALTEEEQARSIHHPAADLGGMSEAEWSEKFSDWRRVAVQDTVPAVTSAQKCSRNAESQWKFDGHAVTVTYTVVDKSAEELATEQAERERLLIGEATSVIQGYLDTTVRGRGYESIATCITYADEPADPVFQAEGLAARRLRSRVWRRGYELLDEVKAGLRPPLTRAELIAELPTIEWPV